MLESAGLIICVDRILSQKGKRLNLYQSQLKNAYIFFGSGKLRVRFQLATGVVEDFGGEWKAGEMEKEVTPKED